MIINALKWLVHFLETRFPEKRMPVSDAEFRAFTASANEAIDSQMTAVAKLQKQIDEIQKHIEILNLRVGLTRPTQAAFGRKLNG